MLAPKRGLGVVGVWRDRFAAELRPRRQPNTLQLLYCDGCTLSARNARPSAPLGPPPWVCTARLRSGNRHAAARGSFVVPTTSCGRALLRRGWLGSGLAGLALPPHCSDDRHRGGAHCLQGVTMLYHRVRLLFLVIHIFPVHQHLRLPRHTIRQPTNSHSTQMSQAQCLRLVSHGQPKVS